MTISAVIPSYGRASILRDLVGALLVQRRAPEEIIVVHQCPEEKSEGTADLRGLAKQGRIRLLETDFANAQRARNLGIREARGDLVLLLDDDVRISPDLVRCHRINYEKDPTLDGVAGQVLLQGQSASVDVPPSFYWSHVGWQFFPLNYGLRTATINWPSTNSSVRRELAMKVGGFDEQYERTWLDDTDFSCRLLRAGAKLVFDPSATVVHLKESAGGKRLASQPFLWMDREGWATHFYFWRKNFGLWRARHPFGWNLRYLILRKAVLVRPHWLAINLGHLIGGYHRAAWKLRIGSHDLQSQRRLPSEGGTPV